MEIRIRRVVSTLRSPRRIVTDCIEIERRAGMRLTKAHRRVKYPRMINARVVLQLILQGFDYLYCRREDHHFRPARNQSTRYRINIIPDAISRKLGF
ncbi:hypothetical protein ACEUZ9_002832 [Paracoccus litorisediminis]|uniref:hypothetical protein n=1 Tax=Paracoccus litorisediminis TaxID=2006130 RepID=UPI00372F5A54